MNQPGDKCRCLLRSSVVFFFFLFFFSLCIHVFFNSVTFMDSQVGRVLEALESLGLANDTVTGVELFLDCFIPSIFLVNQQVVGFMADHGYQLGEHCKLTLWVLLLSYHFLFVFSFIFSQRSGKNTPTTSSVCNFYCLRAALLNHLFSFSFFLSFFHAFNHLFIHAFIHFLQRRACRLLLPTPASRPATGR